MRILTHLSGKARKPLDMLKNLSPDRPVLIAGPTASGKSSLALAIAEAQGGVIVNADALQVFDGWSLLTARPSQTDLTAAQHALYGHVSYRDPYSVGDWLRAAAPFIDGGPRPIIVGGTGLYFRALTEGLAEIPPTPPDVRAEADTLSVATMLHQLSQSDRAQIDIHNRARVQRAWEVQRTTSRSLATWQAQTPPPLLPLEKAHAFVLDAPKEWLTPRIEQRFDWMLANGALDETRAMLPDWDPTRPSSKAIGAPELIAHLKGDLSLEEARARAIVASRQYAKRQRTWFRARMKDWESIAAYDL